MYKKLILKKGLALVTILFLISINAISTAGNLNTNNNGENTSDQSPLNQAEDCYPVFYGVKGTNNWFIEDVIIWFDYIPERVTDIFYRIDSQTWTQYDFETFTFSKEGDFVFEYYWLDAFGNETYPQFPAGLRLDKTAPSVQINTKLGGLKKNKLTIEADAKDTASGILKVEFYFDGELNFTDTEEPYKLVYKNAEKDHTVKAVVYDLAGWIAEDEIITEPYSFPAIFLRNIIHKLSLINPIFLYIFKQIL